MIYNWWIHLSWSHATLVLLGTLLALWVVLHLVVARAAARHTQGDYYDRR